MYLSDILGKKKSGEEERKDDSSSDEIEEFVPPTDPKLSDTLEQAVAEPESEEDEGTGHTPGLLTPSIPSLNPSREHSDMEADDGNASRIRFTVNYY